MQFTVRVLTVLAVTWPVTSFGEETPANEPRPAFELRDGDRVVFLGNTLVERMGRYGHVETVLTARWPDRNVTFRNLGWSGDTVWAESRGLFDPPAKGYERMIKHVGELKPTVIFLGYGNVEAYAGEQGLPAFIAQYDKLLDDLTRVSAKGVRFVLMSPHALSGSVSRRAAGINESIERYGAAIAELSKGRKRTRYINYSKHLVVRDGWPVDSPPASHDGLHFSEEGYRDLAFSVEWTLLRDGPDRRPSDLFSTFIDVDVEGNRLMARNATIMKTERPLSWEGLAQRLPVDGEPLGVRIEGLEEGRYVLTIDATRTRSATADEWQLGVNVPSTPEHAAADALRKAIVEKNRLYFLKWRPQNVTYLTLFRKHEQGNNAKELEQFDKLVAEKEAEIAKLRQPVKRSYELIRVEADE